MLNLSHIDLYYGAAQALRDVSMQAQKGRITCVLGRNGVGKSSLMRSIMGLHDIAAGDIEWEGQSIVHVPPHQRARKGLAYVPQGREIFPLLTVEENLQTGFAALPRSEHFIPDEIYDLFPVLKDMLWRRGGDLSGGQQQQLAIGRALVTRPTLLVLDEPTEGIQPSVIKDIGRAISYLRAKRTMAIVLVEQYFEFARDLADDFIVMDRGAVVLAGDKSTMVEEDVRRHISV